LLLLAFNEKLYSEIFTTEFFQLKLGAILPVSVGQETITQIKWTSVKNSCVCATLATRDAVTGEEWLKCERKQI